MKDHHLNTFIKFSFNKHLHSTIFNRYFIKLYSKCQNVHEYLPMVVITMVDTHSIRSTKRRKLREEREGEEKIRTRKLEVLKLANLIADVSTPSPLFPRVLWQDIAIKELLVRVRTSTLDECERKLVILNWILRLSFLSVGCLRLRKLLQRCFKERTFSLPLRPLLSFFRLLFFFPFICSEEKFK